MNDELEYLKGLLGAKATDAILKEFTNTPIPEAHFTDRKGYEAALAAVTKERELLNDKPYFPCPAGASKTVNSGSKHVTLETMMWDWGNNFTENSVSTLVFMLTQAASLRKKELTESVMQRIYKRAEDLDKANEKLLTALVQVLRPVMLLEDSGHYKDDLELLLRHLGKAREDIMDRYFPFFASVQPELDKQDKGNIKLGAAIKRYAGKSSDAIVAELVQHSIEGSNCGTELSGSNKAVPDYFRAVVTHEGLKFFVQRKTHEAMHSSSTDVFDNGVTNIDITDKVMLIMQTLFKE